jgi:hypothetical protein
MARTKRKRPERIFRKPSALVLSGSPCMAAHNLFQATGLYGGRKTDPPVPSRCAAKFRDFNTTTIRISAWIRGTRCLKPKDQGLATSSPIWEWGVVPNCSQ